MATRNAFDLLSGGGEGQSAGSAAGSKAKKKSKRKPAAAPAANGSQAPIKPVPAEAPSPPQTARDAQESLQASAVAAGAGEWGALAQQWTEQVLHGDALYTEGGQLVDFKQVLLSSRALELLLEGCLERGAAAADAAALAQLLAAVAHPAAPPAFTLALAQAVAGLGQVAAADPLAPTPAAKRAAGAALGLVRRGVPRPPPARPAEPPAARLARLGGELGRQEARLAGSTQPRELCKTYSAILELLCGQLDVLRPAGGAAGPALPPELAAALKPLQELRAALAARLQEVQAPPKPRLSLPEQLAEAEAGYRKEDAALAGQLSQVEARIAGLEAELAAAKGEAGELRLRRAAAAQHHRHRLEALRSGRPDSGVSAEEVAAAVRRGLGALEGLAGALGGGSGGDAAAPADVAALGQQLVAAEVPVKLAGAAQQLADLSLGQVHEAGTKARFFRERLDKAIKQGEQAAKLGLGDPKLLKQQRATAEGNLKEVLAAAEAAAGGARAAVAAYRERLPAMLRLPSFLPPPPEFLAALEARSAEAAAVLESIRDGSYAPLAPPAVTAAAPASAAPVAPVAPPLAGAGSDASVSSLEARLAALEAENIAAMISSATLEVPSPLAGRTSMHPAMLSSPASNKPLGPAAPIAPAAPAAAAFEPVAEPEAGDVPEAAAADAPPPAVVTFSQALLNAPQANCRKPAARPLRA